MTDSRLGALATRLVLLVFVVAGTGVLFGTLFLPTAMAMTDVVDAVERDVFDVPPLPEAEVAAENSFVFAADGSEIAEINYEESRIPVTLDQVPEVVVNAVVSTEDATFWEHNGVNHRAIVRAAFANARAGDIEQGASTITQQLVKLAYIGVENADQTYDRKIREALWAIELEKRLPKDEILERYLNRAYFGNGVYGIGKAAERYFSKPVEQLEVGEAAMLAGMLRTPEGNNPLRNPDAAEQRRNIVLDQMVINNAISRGQADAAKAEPLADMLQPQPPSAPEQPFFVKYITELLTKDEVANALGTHVDALDAMGLTSEERIASVFQGGLRIHTTLDLELQALADDAIREHLTYEGETPAEIAEEPLGAIVSVEPGTGAVATMALGPRQWGSCTEQGTGWVATADDGRLLCDKTQVNPALPGAGGSGRQPGSSFKPFLIAAALEAGYPPGWQVDATGPQEIPGCDNGRDWRVNNSGGDGIRDMYSGVKASSNVFHALLIEEVGPAKVKDMAQRLGVRASTVGENCSLALGAVDVTPLEMATAYATLANRGEYCPPAFITRIEDRDGKLIYEHTPDCERVISTDVADRVVDIMQGPVTPGGTAGFMSGAMSPHPVRGKTGTTQDSRDAWFMGYTRDLATAAWIGYDNQDVYDCDAAPDVCADGIAGVECLAVNEERNTRTCFPKKVLEGVTIAGDHYRRVYGGTIPAPMWATYMAAAMEGREAEGWPEPGPVPMATVPDLLEAGSIAAAEDLAEKAKLHLKVEEVDHWKAEGTFVGQSPEGGARVPAGSLVVLQVSNGEGEAPTVPAVVGLDRAEAIEVLEAAGYAAKVVEKEVTDPARDDRVLAQSPSAGEPLAPVDGATVVIQVGVFTKPEPEPTKTKDPDPPPPTETESPTETDTNGNGNGNGNGNNG